MIIFVIMTLMAAACYLLGAAWYFWLWLELWQASNPNNWIDDLLESSVVLLIATLFWPLVVSICYSKIVEGIIRRRREALSQDLRDGDG